MAQHMKVLAFSDLHRNWTYAEKIVAESSRADVVVCAGDLASKGEGLDDTVSILRCIAVPTILVAGNHESVNAIRSACLGWKTGYVLHGEAMDIGGVTFFGLGYEIPNRSTSVWNNALSEEAAREILMICPPASVLITHTPAFGVADLQADGSHGGSVAILDFINHNKPRIHLCGHIHNAWSRGEMIGGCLSRNLGPSVNWFDL